MTSSQHIDYDALALEALRGVVKLCLTQVARDGLAGEHHFYIAFNTQAAGVGMSKRLKEKYPVEMTIVLQHRFWDLLVDDERFEVKLTFDGIPERLVVPFSAVKVFYDPSVPYVLQFEESDPGTDAAPAQRGPRRIGGLNGPVSARDGEVAVGASDKPDRRKPNQKSRSEQPSGPLADRIEASTQGDETADALQPAAPPPAAPVSQSGSRPAVAAVGKTDGDGEDQAQSSEESSASSDPGSAKIFDLSKFRGKK